MPIYAPESTSFTPATAGEQQGVIAKVVDLGLVKSEYKGKETIKPKIQVIWQVTEKDEKNLPKRVSQFFTLSLDQKANLYKFCMQLFGKVPDKSFDFSELEGTNRNLLLVPSPDGKYTNVAGILALKPGQAKLKIVPFEVKSKVVGDLKPAAAIQGAAGTKITEAAPITDDDIPF
jgi:hypothetical protein